VADAAARVGVRPSTAKRHLADLRARSGLTTEQLIYQGRAEGWLVVPSLEP
jgi:predicted ArsR family transcriptional regulator